MQKKLTVLSGLMFFCALAALAYSIWAAIYCYGDISSAIDSAQITAAGNEFLIASYYVSYCGMTGMFAVVFAALGWMTLREVPKTAAGAIDVTGGIDAASYDENDDALPPEPEHAEIPTAQDSAPVQPEDDVQ